MKIEMWPIDRPVEYARNARKITDAAVEKIAASVKQFGFRQPVVVDSEGVIIVGHARRRAALKLGMTEIPVHVAADMSAADAKAYRLADNRTGLEIKFDFELLALELSELKNDLDFDLSLTGFEAYEIDPLLAAEWNPPAVEDTPSENESPAESAPDMRKIMFTLDQHEVIMQAVSKIRTSEGDPNISEGRCLELIVGDWSSGLQ